MSRCWYCHGAALVRPVLVNAMWRRDPEATVAGGSAVLEICRWCERHLWQQGMVPRRDRAGIVQEWRRLPALGGVS